MRVTWLLVFGSAFGILLGLAFPKRPQPVAKQPAARETPSINPAAHSQEIHHLSTPTFSGSERDRLSALAPWVAQASLDDLLAYIPANTFSTVEWRVILTRWAELDPDAFVDDAIALITDGQPFEEALVWEILTEVDLKRAVLLAEARGLTLPSPTSLHVDNPATLIAWLESTEGDKETREEFLPIAYKAWLEQDRVTAMRSIEELEDTPLKKKLVAIAAGVWVLESPEEATAWVLEISEFDQFHVPERFDAMLASLESSNQAAAWSFLKNHWQSSFLDRKYVAPTAKQFQKRLFKVVQQAAYHDPQGVLSWIGTISSEYDQQQLIEKTSALATQTTDPNAAIASLPEGPNQVRLALQILTHQFPTLKGRIKEIKTLHGIDRDLTLTRTLLALNDHHGREIANHVNEWQHLPIEQRDDVIRTAVQKWDNTEEAAEWLSQLPSDIAQPKHFYRTWNQWTNLDPTAASQALSKLLPGPQRDAAIHGLLGNVLGEFRNDSSPSFTMISTHSTPLRSPDFDTARQWAEVIEDTQRRNDAIERLDQVEARWQN